MMLEPAQRAGDAPRIPPEHDRPTEPYSEDDLRADDRDGNRPTRISPPGHSVRCQAEHDRWLRRHLLERQLHDGAALRISALALQLGLFRHRVPATELELRESIDRLQDELHTALQELRDVAGKIYPSLLDEAGLGPALREMTYRVATPVSVDAPDMRFGPATEGVAYFAVTECLDALDSNAPPVEVLIRRDVDVLTVQMACVDVRHALLMDEEVRRMGGTVDVVGDSGIGTIIARIPCE